MKNVESNPPSLRHNVQFVYKLAAIKRDAEGNEVSRRESEDIPNVFTNHGIEAIFGNGGSSSSNISSMAFAVGTGSSAPSVSNTTLDSFLVGRYHYVAPVKSFVNNGDGTGYVQKQWTLTFTAGSSGGNVNISEVGAYFMQSNPTSGSNCISRALVVDGGGSPTTFEWRNDEELQLTGYFRIHVSLGDIVTYMTFDGSGVATFDDAAGDYTVTIRPMALANANVDTYYWGAVLNNLFNSVAGGQAAYMYGTGVTLEPATGTQPPTPSGGGSVNDAQGAQRIWGTYSANSKQNTITIGAPQGAARDVVGFYFVTGAGAWQCKISPPVPKSSLHRFRMTFTVALDNTP